MNITELQNILEQHKLWLTGNGKEGKRANLRGANLRGANLQWANLRGANLRGANLRGANLQWANLRGANLRGANLRGANLYGANLQEADLYGANLRRANLQGANLQEANLQGADLQEADLYGADLQGANLPNFFVIPEIGQFIGWKKLIDGKITKLLIPDKAKRTSSLIGRKCRAEYVKVLAIYGGNNKRYKTGYSSHDGTKYIVGKIVKPDKYDDDIRVECTNGIHFFITRKEAEEY